MIKLGFVLLSHRAPQQTRRLIDRLVSMFDAPPIACHHDFGQSTLEVRGLPDSFRLVQPHLKTSWSDYSIVEATLAALRLLYAGDQPPDWFAVLSGADYPIKPADQILHDLQTASADVFLRYRLIDRTAAKHSWQWECLRRYRSLQWRLHSNSLPRFEKTIRLPPILSAPFLPFSKTFRCFAGANWFTGNARSAEYLLAESTLQRQLARHYAKAFCPEESFFHCLLCNAPQLRLANDHLRYIDWRAGGRHPKTLTCDDLPELSASSAHFARKFDIQKDVAVLDRLDDWLCRSAAPLTKIHAA